jgi:hypothetical protein
MPSPRTSGVRLAVLISLSVMSDVREMVRAGGELTLCFRLSAVLA